MRTFIFAIAFTLAVAATVIGQAAYSVTDLGHLDDGFGTYALAINNQGHVVGVAADTSGHYLAFLYAGGPLQSLGNLGGGFSQANSINSSDRIVGRSKTAAGNTHAFLYDAGQVNPSMVDLHNVLGFEGNFSSAISINDAGQIVGVATVPGGNRHAFLLTGNTPVDLHSRISFGGLNSIAYSISNSGWIAGMSDDTNGKSRAFLYNLNTSTLTNLGTLGGLESAAWAVSESGNAVGESSVIAEGETTYAFQTVQPNPIGSASSLGALGGTYSTALGINSLGQIVGAAEDATALGHAFIYTTAVGMQDLESLIPANSGWFFISATAINDSGFIVGNGVHNLQSAAFLLTPNTPPTPALGNYPDTSLPLSGDTTVASSTAPTNTTSINVSTSTNFNGKLEGDPITGSVRVTDAHPAGTYTVTVTAFNGSNGPTTTKTFTLTVTTPPTCNPISFAAATFEVGDRVGAVLVGDFNGDGRQDLAVTALDTNFSARSVILLGDGAGHFNSVSEVPIGARAVADFNGDGKQDLVGLNSNNAVLYLGDGTGHFTAGNTVDTGCASPFQLAIGDFNADGKLDLAFACFFTDTVTILLGNGAGGFSSPVSFGVSDGPQGLAVGDFDSDGKQDLAVACMPAGVVSILLGDGAGSFAAATNFNAGATPRDIEIGDFNEDGNQDLALSNPSTNSASVMLGNGAGGFGAPTSFAVGSNPTTEIAVGDFNGDGEQDLAVPNFGSSNVSLLLGNGAGGFGSTINFAVGLSPFGVVVGDFNGDGKQDLATANWDSNNVSILLRDCVRTPSVTTLSSSLNPSVAGQSVTFTANVTSASGTPTGSVEFFDYAQSLGVVSLSAGSASFTTVALVAGSHSITAVYSGDASFLGSTSPALVQTVAAFTPVGSNVTVQETAGSTTIVITFSGVIVPGTTTITPIDPASAGTLPGGFSISGGSLAFDISTTATFLGPVTVCFQVPSVTDPAAFSQLRVLHSAPKLDLATANSSSNNASVLLGNGVGAFTTPTNFAVGTSPRAVASGDFNGDGKPDIAVANFSSQNVSILLGTGSGSFGSATNVAVGGAATSIAAGDFNGDGRPDLAVANYPDSAQPRISILLGNGSGGFSPATNLVVNNPRAVALGDFNGDGKVDLTVIHSNTFSILLGDGLGGFALAGNLWLGAVPQSVSVGDYNTDGKLDLAIANYGNNNVAVLLGNGAGGMGPASYFPLGLGFGPVSIAAGDFNGDRKLDLVTANYSHNNVSLLLGNGAGGFGPAVNFAMGSGPLSVVAADFNNDGKLDLATANFVSDNVSVRLGLGTGSFGAATNYLVGARPYAVAVGNFNLDVAVIDQTILSGPNAPNFATKTICAQVLSFSPFVIANVLDHTPPVITNVSVSPSVIWPPDHNMIDVTVNYDVSDDFTPSSAIATSLEVSSNEPVNTTGDGSTEPDIEIVEAHHVRLRAERAGTGNGRVYTITIISKDSAQNSSTRTTTVVVPKDQE